MYEDLILRATPIDHTVTFDHSHAASITSNTNVRAVRPGPTRHPFHTSFNQQMSMQNRHEIVVYSESKMAHEDEIT